MSIVIGGYSGTAIVTWGYGDLLVKLFSPFAESISAKFTKLHGDSVIFEKTNDITSLFDRIVAETSNDPVVNPPDGVDLVITPTVFVSFEGINHIVSKYDTIDAIKAIMERVVSEEPIAQVKSPSGGDLQITPTTFVSYEKLDGIAINHEISNKIDVVFERIIAEEV